MFFPSHIPSPPKSGAVALLRRAMMPSAEDKSATWRSSKVRPPNSSYAREQTGWGTGGYLSVYIWLYNVIYIYKKIDIIYILYTYYIHIIYILYTYYIYWYYIYTGMCVSTSIYIKYSSITYLSTYGIYIIIYI